MAARRHTRRTAHTAPARYYAPHPGLQDIDPLTSLFWAPRTVTVLAFGLALLVYSSGVADEPHVEEGDNTRRGIFAAIALFLAYSAAQGPESVLIRPHPAVWRLWHGVSVTYMLFLAFLLLQTPHGARRFMTQLSPALGVELEERAYGEDCRPLYGNIRHATGAMVLDEFVIAHTVGWWAKALMLRHSGMLWAGSILFELAELTFQHLLPNFNECWWDRWLLDVCICNNLGIAAGMRTVRYFKAKKFNWLGLSKQPSLTAKVRRVAGQFLPWSYDDFDWRLTSGPKRCLLCLAPLLVMTSCELNAFFLKRVLWIPPRNALNTCRLCIWVGMALPAMKEYYIFVSDDEPHAKLGAFAWLSLACFALETLVVLKVGAGSGLFLAPLPRAVRACWSAVLGLLCTVWLAWAWRAGVARQRAAQQSNAAARADGNSATAPRTTGRKTGHAGK